MSKEQDETPVPAKVTSEDRMASVLERLVNIQENQPIQQIPVQKAKHVTPWNPEGKYIRPTLKHKTFINGHPLSENMMTEEEIRLCNQLKAGKYNDKQWVVVVSEGDGDSEMFIFWPNKTVAQRIGMADHARSFVEVCQKILAEQKSSKPA